MEIIVKRAFMRPIDRAKLTAPEYPYSTLHLHADLAVKYSYHEELNNNFAAATRTTTVSTRFQHKN